MNTALLEQAQQLIFGLEEQLAQARHKLNNVEEDLDDLKDILFRINRFE